jgi:hypothetical protein
MLVIGVAAMATTELVQRKFVSLATSQCWLLLGFSGLLVGCSAEVPIPKPVYGNQKPMPAMPDPLDASTRFLDLGQVSMQGAVVFPLIAKSATEPTERKLTVAPGVAMAVTVEYLDVEQLSGTPCMAGVQVVPADPAVTNTLSGDALEPLASAKVAGGFFRFNDRWILQGQINPVTHPGIYEIQAYIVTVQEDGLIRWLVRWGQIEVMP